MSDDTSYSKNSAMLLWFAWIFGFGGLHRIYLGKPISGILYLFTWGLFGAGQIIDLLRINTMVDDANGLLAGAPQPVGLLTPAHVNDDVEAARMKLLEAAKAHGNAISVTQGVAATGKTFAQVEAMLDDMASSGYVGIDNDATTGAVIYTFNDLS